MRLTRLAFCAALIAAPLGYAGFAYAQSAPQDFTLINSTGYTINEVHVSPTGVTGWGPDILGTSTLPDTSNAMIHFPTGGLSCGYDLQVIYSDGERAEWRGLNLCQISRVTLFYNRDAGSTRAVTE